jgi:hypothetical protein
LIIGKAILWGKIVFSFLAVWAAFGAFLGSGLAVTAALFWNQFVCRVLLWYTATLSG